MDSKLLPLWMLMSLTSAEYDGILREYCISETFHPTCQQRGHVIVMTHARYGRIQLGKCVKKDYGVLGCYRDILQLLDQKCSGNQNCEVDVSDQEMIDQVPCLEELSPYLEARYICQPVYLPKIDHCSAQEVIEADNKLTFVSSVTSLDTKCGLHNSPWLIEAKKGQHIKISLLDFSWRNNTHDLMSCVTRYGYMLDAQHDDIISICGGGKRQRQIYVSNGHTLQIILHENILENHRFLLSFKTVGCPDYEAPPHSWLETENDTITVSCQSSADTWTLKCVENNWLGVVGSCPAETTVTVPITPVLVTEKSKVHKLPNVSTNHVAAFAMGCVTIMICCTVVILGYYCTKRYEIHSEVKRRKQQETFPAQNTILRMPATYRSVKRAKNQSGINLSEPPTYKAANEQQAPPVPHRTSSYRGGDMTESMMSDYLAPQGGDDNSVQYYILENPTESGGKEEMYQSIHLFSSLERAPEHTQQHT